MDMNGILDTLNYKYCAKGGYFKKGRVCFVNRVAFTVNQLGCFVCCSQPFIVDLGEQVCLLILGYSSMMG